MHALFFFFWFIHCVIYIITNTAHSFHSFHPFISYFSLLAKEYLASAFSKLKKGRGAIITQIALLNLRPEAVLFFPHISRDWFSIF